MKFICLVCTLFFTNLIISQTKDIIELWPNQVPNQRQAKKVSKQTSNVSGNVIRLTDVTNPTLTVFKPQRPNATKAGIIVCPGGGYNILAIDKEGYEVAEWFNSLGYTAFVLEYRVPKNRNGALQDLQRAIRWVRSNNDMYSLDAQKIGVLGFSAGGHLSVNATVNYQKQSYTKIDSLDNLSCRPNFTMLIYPAYLDMGEDRKLSPEFVINENTPPFFVFGTSDDRYGNSALVIATSLRDKNVPVELHMLPEGGHGYGLRKTNLASKTWPILAEAWLERIVNSDKKLNDIQIIGSHNSYKIKIEQPLFNYLHGKDSLKAKSLEYGHVSMIDQLNMGLRNLELDVFHDPIGGRFLNPKGLDIVKKIGEEALEFDVENSLKKPGLKMFHIQDIDFRSHHLLFKDGLKALRSWSESHKDHTPIIILINAKDQNVAGTRTPLEFTKNALDSIDIEIKSVFPKGKLITPDFVRGSYETLERAILANAWPKLNEVKGRFLFVLDEKEEKNKRYLKEHEGLKNRVLFVNVKEGNPEAAFRIINNPIRDFEYINSLVKQGYMVRTRADAGTKEARTVDYLRFNKAKKSGAQVISTDYYIPSQLFKSRYKIIFDDNSYERLKAE